MVVSKECLSYVTVEIARLLNPRRLTGGFLDSTEDFMTRRFGLTRELIYST